MRSPKPGLTRQEESVVLIAGRVLLRLEQRVEVPEGALDEVVGGHFSEPAVEGHAWMTVCNSRQSGCPMHKNKTHKLKL